MKKILLAALTCGAVIYASALPKALYVKTGDKFDKYNFGVAEDLVFSNNGHTLTVNGYDEVINLDQIDYITFTAPVDYTGMTPAAQKEKLIQIGEAVNAMIDVNDFAPLIKMQDDFFRDYTDADGIWHRAPYDFQVPRSLYDLHNTNKSLLKALGCMTSGNVAAVRAFKAAAVDLYKYADYAGIYAPNYDLNIWEKIAEADYFEMRFRAKDLDTYYVRIDASKEYTYWDLIDYAIQVPEIITITFKKGYTQLASAVVKSEFIDGQKLSVDVDVEALDLTVYNDFDVVDNLITDVVEVKLKSQHLIKSISKVDGRNLVTYDVMRNDVENSRHRHDADGNCIDGDPYPLIAHFIRGNTDVDLIGQLQVKGKTYGFDKLYDNFKGKENDGDHYLIIDGKYVNGDTIYSHNSDYSKICVTEPNEVEESDRHVDCLNNYTDVSFSYDGKGKVQGFLAWENFLDYNWSSDYQNPDADKYWTARVGNYLIDVRLDYEYNPKNDCYIYYGWFYTAYTMTPDGDIDWENAEKIYVDNSDLLRNCSVEYGYLKIQPVLIFPDLTTFTFEEYFNKDSFSQLIDDYDSIIDTYDTITGQNK